MSSAGRAAGGRVGFSVTRAESFDTTHPVRVPFDPLGYGPIRNTPHVNKIARHFRVRRIESSQQRIVAVGNMTLLLRVTRAVDGALAPRTHTTAHARREGHDLLGLPFGDH